MSTSPVSSFARLSFVAFLVAAPITACNSVGEALGLDSSAWGRDPMTGECPATAVPGAAAGQECGAADDCAPVCCTCTSGTDVPFAGAACIDGVCAAADVACATVESSQPEACEPLVVGNQEDDACPDEAQDGDDPGDECRSAMDCAGACCTCPDDTTTYEAAQCDRNVCAEEAEACAAALAADPSLCP